MATPYVIRKILGSTRSFLLFVVLISLFLLLGVGVAWFFASNAEEQPTTITTSVSLPATGDSGEVGDLSQKLTVNAQLQVNGQFYLAPSQLPDNAQAGTLVFDQATSILQYFNGTDFVPLTASEEVVIPEAGVTSLQGQTGAITLTPGAGININGTTIASSGILGVNGVAGDIGVTTSNGIASLSLPQSIAPTASPSFNALSLSNALPVSSGGTGGVSFASNGVLIGNGVGAFGVVTAPAPGQCLLSTAGAPTFGACAGGGSGVSLLNGLSGNLTLSNATGVGATITIDDASTSAKGIAQFNSANFSVAAGVVNTIQNIGTTASPTFAGLTLSAPLSVANGGTGNATLADDLLLLGNGTGAVDTVANGTPGQCLVATSGAPIFTTCTGDGVGMLSLTLAGTSGTPQTITDGNTITIAAGTNITTTAGAMDTITIATVANPNFTSLTLGTALGYASGGTNATTAQGAMNNLSGLTANGDILYHNGTNSTRLARGTNGQCLISTGTTIQWATCTGAGGVSSINGNSGAVAIQGTTNQVSVTGNGVNPILLSLPQDIHTGASPIFSGLTLTSLDIGGNTLNSFTGTGLQIASGTLSTTLGTTVEGSEITDNTIEEVDLEVTNLPTDSHILTYDSATGGFTWVDPSSLGDGSGITSLGGQTGASQTFVNDTNITITSSANAHTLGWTGALGINRGGTGASNATDARANLGAEAVLTFSGNGLFSRTGNTINGLSCANGQVPKWSGVAFGCDSDADTTYGAGQALQLSGTVFSLAQQSATAGQVLKWDGSGWAPANDNGGDGDTTYSAGNGLDLTGSVFSVDSPTCGTGEYLSWSGAAFICDTPAGIGDGVGIAGLYLAGSSGTPQALGDGDTITVAGGTNISTAAGATNTITVSVADAPVFSGLITAGAGVAINGDTVTDITGTGLTVVSGALTVDSASLAGNFFIQGGNSFSEAAVLGTNDNHDLSFETNGVNRLTVEAGGNIAINTDTLYVDAANDAVGIGTSTIYGDYQLQVGDGTGDTRISLSPDASGVSMICLYNDCSASGAYLAYVNSSSTAVMSSSGHLQMGATGNAILYSSSGWARVWNGSSEGISVGTHVSISLSTMQFTGSDSTIQSSASGSGNTSGLTIRTGSSGGNGSASGDITIYSGSGNGTGTNSGNINIDAGSATGTAGTINIGAVNASSIILGNTGGTITLGDSALANCVLTTVAGALTCGSAGGDILQDGNSFAGIMTIGTNDAQSLVLETNDQPAVAIASGGAVTFQNAVNSTEALMVNNSGGGNILQIDTVNDRFGINIPSWASLDYSFQLQGQAGSTQSYANVFGASLSGSTTNHQSGNFFNTNGPAVGTYRNYHGIYNQIGLTASAGTETNSYIGMRNTANIWDGDGNVELLTGTQSGVWIADGNGTVNVQASYVASRGAGAGRIVNNSYGLSVENPSGAGTVTNNYGIRIENQTTGTNDYGLYIQGADTYALWVDAGTVRFDGNVVLDATLPVGDNNVQVCRASTGVLSTCVGGSGGDVLQGGNSFGAAMTIGTNDSNQLSLETNNTERVRITNTGSFIVDPSNALLYANPSNGHINIGSISNLGARLAVVGANDEEQLLIRAYSGQTFANSLMLFQDSTGSELTGLRTLEGTSIYFGRDAGESMTTGTTARYNTVFGNTAASNLQNGNANSAFGWAALGANVDGQQNTAIGDSALRYGNTGSFNTAVGYRSLNNTTGNYNTAFGNNAGGALLGANCNTALGYSALGASTAGSCNVAVGDSALREGAAGVGNVAVGFSALRNVAGDGNIALGYQAGEDLTSGSGNILIGNDIQAASATGSFQLNIAGLLTSDDYTVGGEWNGNLTVAGTLSSPGSGFESERFGANTVASATGTIAIGYGAESLTDNSIVIGHSAWASSRVGASVLGYGASSTGQDSVVLGSGAYVSGDFGISIGGYSSAGQESVALGSGSEASFGATALGAGALADNDGAIAIGHQSDTNGYKSIVLGTGATATADNQLVIGSNHWTDAYVTQVYLGSGVTSANAASRDVSINATGGSGSNIGGADLILAGGRGTGTGAGGAIVLQTAASGATGSSRNSLTTRLTVEQGGNVVVGSGTGYNAKLAVVGSSNQTQLLIRANASQTSPLVLAQNSTGDELFRLHAPDNTAVFLGYGAGTGSSVGNSIGIGHNVLSSNTSGDGNIGIGWAAMMGANGVNNSVAIGSASQFNSSGYDNVSVGNGSLGALTGGNSNTALGHGALGSNTLGSSNISLGAYTGSTITTGSNNIVIGTGQDVVSATGNNQLNIAGLLTSSDYTSAGLSVNGHLLPGADDTYDLGSNTYRWRDLYLGPASLHIGVDGNEGVISFNTTNGTFEFNNALAVSDYINFGNLNGVSGYGIRDNNGVIEVKNNGGAWQTLSPNNRVATYIVAASDSPAHIKASADYIADGTADEVEINAALTAGAGGKIYLAEGTYIADGTILIPNNTTLEGAGKGTLIEAASWTASPLIQNSDTSTGTGITIKNMTLDGQRSTIGSVEGIHFENMGNRTADRPGALVENVTLRSFGNTALYLTGSDGNTLTGSTIQDIPMSYAVQLTGSSGNTFTGNTLTSSAVGFGFMSSSNDNRLTDNNIVINTSAYYGVQLSSSSGNIVTSNSITSTIATAGGIQLNSATHSTIANNTIKGALSGIGVGYDSHHNTITGNTITDSQSDGIDVSGANNNIISANRIHNSGVSSGSSSGITLSSADSNQITSNQITDTAGTGYAIDIANSASDNTYLADNTYSGTGASSINDAGTGTVYGGQLDASNNFSIDTGGNLVVTGTAATCTIGNGTGATSCSSDQRLKHDIQGTTGNLAKITQLTPVSYVWNSDSTETQRIGLIAQDVQLQFPEAVTVDAQGFLQLDYAVLVSPLIGAVKELSIKVDHNTSRIEALEEALAVVQLGSSIEHLSVNGNLSTAQLTVTGVASIGELNVAGTIEAVNIKVNGKFISTGQTATAVLGAQATGNSAVAISGNDIAGTVSYTAGTTGLTTGEQVKITFSSPYEAQPRITLTPASADAAEIRYYVERNVTEFTIHFIDAPEAGATYKFDYQVIQ